MKIIEVKLFETLNQDWQRRIAQELDVLGDQMGRKNRNYSPDKLDIEGHIAFHALVDENDHLIAFSGVYNGGRFPEGVYRILNRSFVHPQFRREDGRFEYLSSRHLVPHQLEKLGDEVKLPFVSREGRWGGSFLEDWCERYSPKGWGNWEVPTEFYNVMGHSDVDHNGFQKVALPSRAKNLWEPEKLTLEEWQIKKRLAREPS